MKKKEKLITLRLLLIAIVLLLIVVSALLNYQLRNNMNENVYQQLSKDTQLVSKEVSLFVTRYIEMVKILSTNEKVKDYVRDVDSFDEKRSHMSFEDVEILLNEFKSVDEDIEHVWVGFNAINDYLLQDTSYDHNDPDYYYAERPWYLAMIANNSSEVTISPLYVSMIDGTYQVSLLSPVMPEGYSGGLASDNIGQVGVDLNLRHITRYISQYRIGEKGRAIMIDEFGNYVVKPDGWSTESNILQEKDARVTIGQRIIQGGVNTEPYKHQGDDVFVSYSPVEGTPWYIMTYIHKDEVTGQIAIFNMMTTILAIAVLVILIVSYNMFKIKNDNQELLSLNNALKGKEKELRETNIEISAAYQQLAASEEELQSHFDEIQNYSRKLEEQETYIKGLAYIDPLTEIPNRRKFIEEMEFALKHNHSGAVIMLDLDNFKQINDTMGHVYGDELLKQIANKLNKFVSSNIFVSRFGGDEFLILFDNCTDIERIETFAKSLVASFDQKISLKDDEIFISMSMGVARYPLDSSEVSELIMFADTAMYEVKESGKNNYIFFNQGMATAIKRKLYIEKILRECLERELFTLVYQPQVLLEDESIVGAEALLRIKEFSISPGEFIPVAEESGLIIEIGRRVVYAAIEQQRKWMNEGVSIKPVSINFSPYQMNDESFVDFLQATLEAFEVPARMVCIEITESILLENENLALARLHELGDIGVSIALDDFGTGYSSLSYLTYLPVNVLKLDKSLSDRFLAYGDSQIVEKIIGLAHSLDIEALAEGVETKEQVSLLKKANCDKIQGYYYSKPLPKSEYAQRYLLGNNG